MILSLHIAKTAGNSFRESLMETYGKDRVYRDYGDWAGFDEPFANKRRADRTTAMRARRDELLANYDVIHGHFVAEKYMNLFPQTEFVTFFRDPYQQSISHWAWVMKLSDRKSDVNTTEHAEVRYFRELQPTLSEYLRWPMYRDQQSQYMEGLQIEDLACCCLYEEYERGTRLFEKRFSRNLGGIRYSSATYRDGGDYALTSQERKDIERYRAGDIELYARAKECFKRQCSKFGV